MKYNQIGKNLLLLSAGFKTKNPIYTKWFTVKLQLKARLLFTSITELNQRIFGTGL